MLLLKGCCEIVVGRWGEIGFRSDAILLACHSVPPAESNMWVREQMLDFVRPARV
jgi:hypothetical protein